MASQKIRREYTVYDKVMKRPTGLYHKVLITDSFVFYHNYHDTDASKNVEMYRRLGGPSLQLISKDCTANEKLFEELLKQEWRYISQTLKTNYRLKKYDSTNRLLNQGN
jgi:hypothetical protein